MLDAKNKQLANAGRKPIRRYHSKEISNFENDFEDWNGDERTELTKELISRAINGNFLQSVGFTANLRELAEQWPRVKYEGVKKFGYHVMMRLIMMKLEKMIPKQFGAGAHIAFINERCEFDGIWRDAFDHYRDKHPHTRSMFTSITPMGWEECVPLQPADFLAYETMKESHRFRPMQKKDRDRRKSLEAFIDLPSVGITSEEIPVEEMLRWKEKVEQKDRERGKAHLNDRFSDSDSEINY